MSNDDKFASTDVVLVEWKGGRYQKEMVDEDIVWLLKGGEFPQHVGFRSRMFKV